MTPKMIGYEEALALTLDKIVSLDGETVNLRDARNRVVYENVLSMVDSPSVDVSLKDGYAVQSFDISEATADRSVSLQLIGTAAAGIPFSGTLGKMQAVRILTGGKVPNGADAVISEEFTAVQGQDLEAMNFAQPGRNILKKGTDVHLGQCLAKRGTRLSPGRIGLLAASGHNQVQVFRRPSVSLIATGNEVVMPGNPLPDGKVYASNLCTLEAWCLGFGMTTSIGRVSDRIEDMLHVLDRAIDSHDALVTSGGAWTGDRDLVVAVLERMGWSQYFHRIRIGPGKAVGFGLLRGKPVFVLPGAPPSNLLSFLMIALPGLTRLGGFRGSALPLIHARLGHSVAVRDKDWTQFVFGTLTPAETHPVFEPVEMESRLQSIALAQAVMAVPEGMDRISANTILSVWNLE